MNDLDKYLRSMAAAESCPVPADFEAHMEEQLAALTESKPFFSRWVVIAACLCVLVFGTAFAAERLWGVFSAGTRAVPNTDQIELFELSMEGTTVFELDELMADLEILAAQRDNDPDTPVGGRVNVAAFDSWQEASTYIGIPLAANAYLEQYAQTECLVGPTTDENGAPLWLYVSTSCLVEGMEVSVNAYLRTTHAGDEQLYAPGISYDASATKVEDKVYQMADGSSGIIFVCTDNNYASYNGAFIKDGIFYWVTLRSNDGHNSAMEQLLEQIMAAYG